MPRTETDLVTNFFNKLDAWFSERSKLVGFSITAATDARIEAENALRDLLNDVTGAEDEDEEEEDEPPKETPDELRRRVQRLKGD
jgi:uncharacterized protein YgfB (UPF0149 family)